MGVHIFGDSHANYIFSRVPEATIHWRGSRTMHSVGRDGVNFLDGCKGDFILFVFGEIDVRCHIAPLAIKLDRSIEDITSDLARRYVASICAARSKSPISKFAILGVIPPITPHAANPDFPCRGSEAKRVEIRQHLNAHLQRFCADTHLTFIAIPRYYERADGLLKRHLSDGHAHIARDCSANVVRAVSEALGTSLTFDRPGRLTEEMRKIARCIAAMFGMRLALWNLGRV